ncbi:MAG: hypothetical protein RQ767_05250 [Thermovirgaceae bacterium]|nr:hypothetical protein [Thermovirgaceae bacterium]
MVLLLAALGDSWLRGGFFVRIDSSCGCPNLSAMRCLIYAVQRYRESKGYIGFRRTRILKLPFPHFTHFPEECKHCDKMTSFVPDASHTPHKWLPPLWFKGFVKKGDL